MKEFYIEMSNFKFDKSIISPRAPTATTKRIQEYKDYYKIKYDICKKQNPKKIAEIGIRCGYSAWAFLQACPQATYFGYDANNGTHGGKGGEDGSFYRWAAEILKDYSVIFHEVDTQLVSDLYLRDIDFFHVDGDHSVKGVRHDLDLAFRAINDNGLILIDDYTYIQTVEDGVDGWILNNSKYIDVSFIPSLRGETLIRKI